MAPAACLTGLQLEYVAYSICGFHHDDSTVVAIYTVPLKHNGSTLA